MRKLCTLTLVTVLFAGGWLAGCDTTMAPNGDIATSEQAGEALSAAKSAAKIDICHKRDKQGYISINISVNAEAAHRAHGDGQVGDPVPDLPGFIFDENCVPVEACPCWDAADLESVTAANHRQFLSCSTAFTLPPFPDGAHIQNFVFTPGVEGGFSAVQAGFFDPDPVCLTRDLPPFFLVITAAEAAACIQQIADRCAAIGDPLPPPPSAAPKAPSAPSEPGDPSSIWGSN